MQMLSKSGLDETVESFAKFFTAKRPDGVSSKAPTQSKFKDAIDETKALRTLLSVARLLNQSDAPIMAGSAQLAGLLGQSFFMPFALTMFSCLARFRVLIMQILYEVIAAFNLLSATWQKKRKSLIYSVQGRYVSASVLGQTHLPRELECHWDGAKISVTEKKTASVPDYGTIPDIPADPSRLWFVDDRTGVQSELQVPASVAGPSAEIPLKSQVPLHINQGKVLLSQVERVAGIGPIVETQPTICRPDPEDAIGGLSAVDFIPAHDTTDPVEDVRTCNLPLDPPGMPPTIHVNVKGFCESREPSGRQSSDYRHDFKTSSASKKSVAYRSISHRIGLDSRSSGSSNLEIGAKRKVEGIGDEAKSPPAKSEVKKSNIDSKERPTEIEVKEKQTNDIFAMLLGGSD